VDTDHSDFSTVPGEYTGISLAHKVEEYQLFIEGSDNARNNIFPPQINVIQPTTSYSEVQIDGSPQSDQGTSSSSVLVVDDNEFNVEVVAMIIQRNTLLVCDKSYSAMQGI
jgi:hypothetical protein